MRQGAQRLHVKLPAPFEPVKTPAHEVPPSALLKQSALAHRHTRRFGHQGIRVFDRAIPFRVFKFLVFVPGDPVKFQQPVAEAASGLYLAGADLVGFRIPCDNRFGSRPAGGGANAKNVVQGVLPAVARKTGSQAPALAQDFRGQAHQRINLDLLRRFRLWPQSRHELQRAHAARPRVAKALDGVKALRRATLCRQPRIHQRVAKTVRERIGQQARQPMKGLLRQIRKEINPVSQRHRDGRNLDAARRECGIILESCNAASVLKRNRADRSPPKSDLCQRHDSSPHCHFPETALARFRADARCRRRPRSLSCSIGLGAGSGTSRSKRSTRPSTRHTRMKPDN